MKVAFDNTFLTLLIHPDSDSPLDPTTGLPVTHIKHRIEALIDDIQRRKATIVIPSPCLAEVLTAASDPMKVKAAIDMESVLEVAAFCDRSAIELAILNKKHKEDGNKRGPGTGEWQKVKLDKQIVATAKANGATVLYTDDANQTSFALEAGMEVIHTWDLPLPPPFDQADLLDGLEADSNQQV